MNSYYFFLNLFCSAHASDSIDAIDGPSSVSNSQPAVHVSSHQCVNSTNQLNSFKKSNLTSLQSTKNIFRAVPVVAAKNYAGKATPLPVKQSNVRVLRRFAVTVC